MGWIDDHAADELRIAVTLVRFNFGSLTYWTDFDSNVVTSGASAAPAATWIPSPSRVEGISARQGQVAGEVSWIIANEDLAISGAVYAGAVRGAAVDVWGGWIDPASGSTVPEEEILLFSGWVDEIELPNDERSMGARLKLVPAASLSQIVLPRRIVGAIGSAEFKDADCGYVGAETVCSKTVAACAARSNQDRFCGFPFVVPPEFR